MLTMSTTHTNNPCQGIDASSLECTTSMTRPSQIVNLGRNTNSTPKQASTLWQEPQKVQAAPPRARESQCSSFRGGNFFRQLVQLNQGNYGQSGLGKGVSDFPFSDLPKLPVNSKFSRKSSEHWSKAWQRQASVSRAWLFNVSGWASAWWATSSTRPTCGCVSVALFSIPSTGLQLRRGRDSREGSDNLVVSCFRLRLGGGVPANLGGSRLTISFKMGQVRGFPG